MRRWEEFWFRPAAPLVPAFMRIGCGLIVMYALVAYSFQLQEFFGEHAWHDLKLRMEFVRDRPLNAGPLSWNSVRPPPAPATPFQREYLKSYSATWRDLPPPPYPSNADEANYLDQFRKTFGVDLRINGIAPSMSPEDIAYAERYTAAWKIPPPAYVGNEKEEKAIDEYIRRFNADPRMLDARGAPVFSVWFHVLEPRAMMALHAFHIFVAFCFTIGLCTRLSAAVLWFAALSYVHRNPSVLFGVDTMTMIVLLYLMISPCGAAYSVDQLIRAWWARRRGVGPVVPGAAAAPRIGPLVPLPMVSANIAIRLLQIHLCIIYGMSGLSKLLGPAWWTGNAIWMSVASYEFAPMQNGLYLGFLNFLGSHRLLFDGFITAGALFTLAFEIGYPFLIWRPRLRWVFLSSAILIHAGIGLFMGLKVFSLIMLVMNAAFLRPEEVRWIMNKLVPTRRLTTEQETGARR